MSGHRIDLQIRGAVEPADAMQRPTGTGCRDRLHERSRAADLHDVVDTHPAGQLQDGLRPIGRAAIVDAFVGSKRLRPFEFLIAR